jgi:3'-5' exoribonuclease
VAVSGRVARFRERSSSSSSGSSGSPRASSRPTAFLPVAYRDLDELDGFLEHLAREVCDPGYRRLLDALLDDGELRAQWRLAPCTRAGHHAYLGGLLEHTVAVATLAQELALSIRASTATC